MNESEPKAKSIPCPDSLSQWWELLHAGDNTETRKRYVVETMVGSGKTASWLYLAGLPKRYERGQVWSRTDLELVLVDGIWAYPPCPALGDALSVSEGDARARFKEAADELRSARTADSRRAAARKFLQALAELVACLLRFIVRVLLLLLSRLLGREVVDEAPTWKPDPIDTAPQITPRGPNAAFPVITYRGGHFRSTLGSVALAA